MTSEVIRVSDTTDMKLWLRDIEKRRIPVFSLGSLHGQCYLFFKMHVKQHALFARKRYGNIQHIVTFTEKGLIISLHSTVNYDANICKVRERGRVKKTSKVQTAVLYSLLWKRDQGPSVSELPTENLVCICIESLCIVHIMHSRSFHLLKIEM